MADLETFREETRRWLEVNAPAEMRTPPRSPDDVCWGGKKGKYPEPTLRWLAATAERGWTAPTWPREYGGGGLEPAEAKVFTQELARRRLPLPLTGFGLTMIGPTLLRFGNEEQKREHLPKICRGSVAARSGGVRATPSRGRGATSRHCRRRRCATGIISS